MLFEFFLGIRYLKAKRKQTFISVISLISVLGVMVGVMALIVVLSVMNGFREDLMAKILGVNSHLMVVSYQGNYSDHKKVAEKTMEIEGVLATTPYIYAPVMVDSMGYTSGAYLRGVESSTVSEVIEVESMIKEGDLASLDKTHDGLSGIIIGFELAKIIGIRIGDSLSVISPQGKLTPMGRTPNSRKFRVTGIFDSGMYEYDSRLLLMSLENTQDFLGMGNRISGIEVKVNDVYKADKIGDSVAEHLGHPFWAKDWKMMNKTLVSALKLEKTAMFVILTMIILVGALNIISALVMIVMEKNKDIAILRAMGASPKNILTIFMFQGTLIGIVGTIAGLASGLGICHILKKYQFIKLPADIYYISSLPVKIEMFDVMIVVIAALAISFMATLYPSWHASRVRSVEALRYE